MRPADVGSAWLRERAQRRLLHPPPPPRKGNPPPDRETRSPRPPGQPPASRLTQPSAITVVLHSSGHANSPSTGSAYILGREGAAARRQSPVRTSRSVVGPDPDSRTISAVRGGSQHELGRRSGRR